MGPIPDLLNQNLKVGPRYLCFNKLQVILLHSLKDQWLLEPELCLRVWRGGGTLFVPDSLGVNIMVHSCVGFECNF